jgi:hypothetical protein
VLSLWFSDARNVETPSPCVRLSRTPWVDVTPPTTTGPLPLQVHWCPVHLSPTGKLLQVPALLTKQFLR